MASNADDERPGDDDETNADKPDEGGASPPNPFAGTPLESLFGTMGSGQMPDLQQLMGQVQQLLTPHEGNINWDLATQTARQALTTSPDPSPLADQKARIADAGRLAEHWLDDATDLPSATSTVAAWSRAEWVEATRPTWQRLVEPIADNVVRAMGEAMPAEARQMAGPLLGILNQVGGAMFGQQVGQAIGELAGEVVGTTDVGLPLTDPGTAALLPANVAAFGSGLAQSDEDVLLYLALREAAHHRLFDHVPWLRGRLFGAVEEFGRGTTIDVSKIEDQLTRLDPSDPQSMQEALAGGLFEPERTPTQQAALDRLETLLALVEGWVDEVVTQATRDRMPSAQPLREAIRRRRAAGGPAEQTFASLVGLELRPRRLRDAANLWAAMRDAKGAAARDAVWAHPDLMPGAADLDDPLGFVQSDRDAETSGVGDDAFDEALARLLDDGPAPDDSDDSGGGSTQ
ncbi:MAG TPA: zinc-dependent metalloprotease [Nocardioidaceae bacterium]|nr:zinc-dependent metalloprotease [Nocardioidaceae bacterium]